VREGPVALTGLIALARSDDPVVAISAGGLGERQAFVQASLAAGGGHLSADLAHESSDGWIPVVQGRGAADRALTLDATSAAIRYDGDLGDTYLSARLSGYSERRGSGIGGALSRSTGAQLALTAGTAPLREGFGWRAQGWLTGSNLYNTAVSTAVGRAIATPANRQYDTPALGFGASLEAQAIQGGLTLRGGMDVRGASGESREQFRYLTGAFTRNRVAGGDAHTVGAFAEAAVQGGDWTLGGGVRADYWRDSYAHRTETNAAAGAQTLNRSAADQDGIAPTARLAGTQTLMDGLTLRAATYVGFRPPTLNELHRPFRVGNDVTEANPGLKPERLSGAEVGLTGKTGPIRWTAGLFANRLADAVTNVTVASGPITDSVAGFIPVGGVLRQRRNVDAVNGTGAEVSAQARLSDALTVTLTGALTRARVEGGSGAVRLTGLRPAGTPDMAINARLDWRVSPTVHLSGAVRREGRRFDDDQNLRPLRAATTGSLQAAWTFQPGRDVSFAFDNIGQRAQTARDASGLLSYGPPTTVRISLILRR
jgi:outer membrane receptor protein involved in Fe transport